MDASLGSWLGLFGLGAFHGINPGMGWLFAVALGMQEGRRSAVLRALGPLAAGHVLAVVAALALAAALGAVVPATALRWPIAGLLVGLGVYRLWRRRHPRWVGMRVGAGGLTCWSFLMASAHGAGLMVIPLLIGVRCAAGASPGGCQCGAAATRDPGLGILTTLVHGGGYLLVMAAVALLVFEKVGLAGLRRAWLNVDIVWAGALVATGVLTAVL